MTRRTISRSPHGRASWLLVTLTLGISSTAHAADAPTDPYEAYVRHSRDFHRVRQPRSSSDSHFPAWVNMPWPHRWTIGESDTSAQWAKAHGYNGGVLNGTAEGLNDADRHRLSWFNQHDFRFYLDHAAAKRRLHLWDGDAVRPHLGELHGNGIRPVPLNNALRDALRETIRRNVDAVKASPQRAAYALDDELSWGHFIHPAMWQITDDPAAYANWLREIHGPNPPIRDRWITYEAIRPKLADWTLAQFDASALLDQWTFNDSTWLNFLGDLVTFTNELDPRTPCGIVGGQSPSPFGGYDYAKLMRKVQFIESYNLGSSQNLIRSFNPNNALPTVTTHFHRSTEDDIWQTWYYLVHGNRGFIDWVDGWFEGATPALWHDQVAPTYREANTRIGPLLADARWIHDGVALYYSHASIQLGWTLDAAAHGKTWINRNDDARLGSSHGIRHAWENLLRDAGLQANFLSYADVIEYGIPSEYQVLILPACLALSDVEVRHIEAFCRAGGTVIADVLPALWDQHGKGRPQGGALDALFGVHHDPNLRAADLFNGNTLWCETDQDANYGARSFDELLTHHNTCLTGPEGYHRAVRAMPKPSPNRQGAGAATLLNESPQRYNAYREAGHLASQARKTFLDPVLKRIAPWVRLQGAGEAEHGYEFTYWSKAGRTIVCLVLNPEILANDTGGGHAAGLKTGTIPVVVSFRDDVNDVRDERTGKRIGNGRTFALSWIRNEAVILSFEGDPPRQGP